jgi:hypothetical protein
MLQANTSRSLRIDCGLAVWLLLGSVPTLQEIQRGGELRVCRGSDQLFRDRRRKDWAFRLLFMFQHLAPHERSRVSERAVTTSPLVVYTRRLQPRPA